MNEEIKKLALPLLMAEGMTSPEYIDVLDLDRLWIDRDGKLMAPTDFAKACRKQRPHLFTIRGYQSHQPDRLTTFVYPNPNTNAARRAA